MYMNISLSFSAFVIQSDFVASKSQRVQSSMKYQHDQFRASPESLDVKFQTDEGKVAGTRQNYYLHVSSKFQVTYESCFYFLD